MVQKFRQRGVRVQSSLLKLHANYIQTDIVKLQVGCHKECYKLYIYVHIYLYICVCIYKSTVCEVETIPSSELATIGKTREYERV